MTAAELAEKLEKVTAEQLDTVWGGMRLLDDIRQAAARLRSMEEALQYVDDCFNAALAEGWIDALANNDRDLIEDLWRRRISYAWSNTLNVLQDKRGE